MLCNAGVTEQQLEQARTSIERIVISRVYFYAMYPNGDGDISRDQYVFFFLFFFTVRNEIKRVKYVNYRLS